jgi:hypothetical protein
VLADTPNRTPHWLALWRNKCSSGLRFGFCADNLQGSLRNGSGSQTAEVLAICEVRMRFMTSGTVKSVADVISGILNCVCPECGGRMGERGEEFRCQGECLTDWRQAWERASAEFGMRSKRAIRRI